MKIAVVGAGKTGRGFIARLLTEGNAEIVFIDKDKELIDKLNSDKKFTVSFFGNVREPLTVSDYTAFTWDNAAISDVSLILVSVCGQNLPDVGASLTKLLDKDKHYTIITCENSKNPSKVLGGAIIGKDISVSESTVFCTTTNSGLDISSENYPYLQCNADLLDGYVPPVSGIRPVENFGNFLTRKLFTYNAASCVIAYLGWYSGFSDYAEAANNDEIQKQLDENYELTNKALCKEFGYEEKDQAEFALLSRNKFCSRTIIDTVARNAREPQRKIADGERIIGPMKLILKNGDVPTVLIKTAAIMLMYDNDGEDEWRKIRTEKSPEGILTELCGLPEDSFLFGEIMKQYEALKK